MIKDFILCLYALPSKYMRDCYPAAPRKRRKIDRWYGNFFYKLAEIGIQNVMVFAYSNELYLSYSPWKHYKFHPDHLVYELEEHNEFYWGRNRKIHTLAHKNGVRLIPVLFPGRYGSVPFENNNNGVSDLFDDNARRYQRRYLRRMFRVLSEVYGKRNPVSLWASGSNEVAHNGNHDRGRQIAHRHHEWWATIEEHVPLHRWIANDSHSDYIKAGVIESHQDPDGYWLGHDGYDREIWVDWHGFGIKRDMYKHIEDDEENETYIEFCRNHGFKHIINSDGATSGSGLKYLNGPWTNSTRKELNQLCRFIWMQPKFKGMIADLPKEPFKWITLQDGRKTIIEDFSLLDFNRLNGLQKIWKEMR